VTAELVTFVHASVALATPIALAATGETISESAGVLNLGLEGTMLVGAFAAVLGVMATGSPAAGLAVAVASGAAFAGLLALLVLAFRADQVIAGTALNLAAAGLTAVVWRAVQLRSEFGATGGEMRRAAFSEIDVPFLSDIPVVGPALFHHHPIALLTIAAIPLAWIFLFRSAAGLRLRAVGESPEAAAAFGISVARTRLAAILASGAFGGAAGACLSIADASTFIEGMSSGRGFVAIALVIFGGYRPLGAGAAALLFGAALALQYRLQASGSGLPPELFRSLPYALSLVVLAGFAGRRRAPAALGRRT